jgi:hypothetical protein
VVVTGTISSVAADWTYGLVVGDYIAADGKRHIKVNVNGGVTDYKFDVAYGSGQGQVPFMSDAVAKFKPSADGSIAAANFTKLDPTDPNIAVSGTVTAVGGNYVTVGSTTLLLTSKTQVFNLNGSAVGSYASLADVVVGLSVTAYKGADGDAVVVTYNP